MNTTGQKMSKAEQKAEEKKLQEELKKLKDKKKQKSSNAKSQPVIVFNNDNIPMSEQEVDEEYSKILDEMGASEEVKRAELSKPIGYKYNIIRSRKKRLKNTPAEDSKSAQKLIDAFRSTRSSEILSKIEISLRTEPIRWVADFLQADGLQMLTEALATTNLLKSSKDQDEAIMQSICVKAFRAILNTDIGMEAFLKERDAVRTLALILDTHNINTRIEVLYLLAIVCSWSDTGFDLVLDAMNFFKLIKREPQRFYHLVHSMREIKDQEYRANVMMMINALLSSPSDDTARLYIQRQLENLGIVQLVEEMKEVSDLEVLDVQIKIFEEELLENEEFPDGDLSSPEFILKQLLINLGGTKATGNLMNVLLQLLNYSRFEADKEKRSHQEAGWELLERIVRKACEKGDGSVADFSPTEIRLNDRVKILQSELMEKDTSIFKLKKESQAKIEQLQKEKTQIEEEAKTIEAKLREELDLEKKKNSEGIESIKKQYEQNEKELNEKINEYQREISTLQSMIRIMEKKQDDKNPLIDEWKKKYADYEEMSKRRIEQLTNEIKELKAKVEPLEKEKLQLQEKIEKLQKGVPSTPGNAPPPPPPPPGDAPPPPPPPPGMGAPPPPPPPPGMPGMPPPPPPPPGMPGMPPPPPPPPGMPGVPPPPPPPGMPGMPPPPPPPGMPGMPPPPPGMPGMPPPPPGMPGFGVRSQNPQFPFIPDVPLVKPKGNVRQFHFEQIEKRKLKDTIFITAGITKETNNIIKLIDVKELEEAFASKPAVALGGSSGGTSDQPPKPEVVTLLDSKRSYNVSLQLGSLRGVTFEELRQAIITMDETIINEQNIATMKQIVPTPEETEIVMEYQGTDPLAKAESFFRVLGRIPNVPMRLDAWSVKMKFAGDVAAIKPDLQNVILAVKEMKESKKFLRFLGIVMTVGNFLNGKNVRKLIYGFKLKSLIKLNDTKAADGKTSLLQWIVSFIEKKEPELLKLDEELQHVTAASRVVVSAKDEDIKNLKKGVNTIKNYMKIAEKEKLEGDNFVQVMSKFLENVEVQIEEIDEKWKEMIEALKTLAKLYDEDEKELLKEPDKFFQGITDFLTLFKQAHEKNVKARELEEKKKKQEEKEKQRQLERERRAKERLEKKDEKKSLLKRPGEKGRGGLDDAGERLRDGTLLRKKRNNRRKLTTFNDSFKKTNTKLDSSVLNSMF